MSIRLDQGQPLKVQIDLAAEAVEVLAEEVKRRVLAELHESSGEAASPYLTVPEAATLLRCSRGRVDDLLSQRRLTRLKDGRRTLVARAEVENYLRKGAGSRRRLK